MTAPKERDDEQLRALFSSEAKKHPQSDQELSEALAAYQKVEALFDLLRRPANTIETQPDDDLAPASMLGDFAILRPPAAAVMRQLHFPRQHSLPPLRPLP